ncbi:MAG: hypothetical protein ACYS22_01040 [Planctomycetota bacterium]|jgi:hypothetical protein
MSVGGIGGARFEDFGKSSGPTKSGPSAPKEGEVRRGTGPTPARVSVQVEILKKGLAGLTGGKVGGAVPSFGAEQRNALLAALKAPASDRLAGAAKDLLTLLSTVGSGAEVAAALLAGASPGERVALGKALLAFVGRGGGSGALLGAVLSRLGGAELAEVVRGGTSEQLRGLASALRESPGVARHLAANLPADALNRLTEALVESGSGKAGGPAEQAAAGESLANLLAGVEGDAKIALLHHVRSDPLLFNDFLVPLLHVTFPPITEFLLEGLCPCNVAAIREALDAMRDRSDSGTGDRVPVSVAAEDIDRWLAEQEAEYQAKYREKQAEQSE